MLVVKGVFPFKKCFMCTISARNTSSLNSLKCENYVNTSTSLAMCLQLQVMPSCTMLYCSFTIWFLVMFTISVSLFLLFMCKTPKSDLTHNHNNKQYNSVLKGAWEHITKIQLLHNSVEMLFLYDKVVMFWCPTTSNNNTKHQKHKASTLTWY